MKKSGAGQREDVQGEEGRIAVRGGGKLEKILLCKDS